jgi:hypothetical protein
MIVFLLIYFSGIYILKKDFLCAFRQILIYDQRKLVY